MSQKLWRNACLVVFVVVAEFLNWIVHCDAQSWDKIVTGAEREGKVVVLGPRGPKIRAVMQRFEEKFPKIRLEYTSLSPREFIPRILAERRAEQKLWDVYVQGPNSVLTGLKPIGALAPVQQAFVLPEVKDDKYWYGGLDYGFLDKEKKLVYAFVGDVTPPIFVNRTVISTSQLHHPRQLSAANFRGKIVIDDPQAPGGGSVDLGALLTAYGTDFVRKLIVDQQAVFGRDRRQIAEWLVLGKYPIAIGVALTAISEYQAQGLGQKIEPLTAPEIELWSPSVGALALLEGAPHPNSSIVFVNWLLSRDTQRAFTEAYGLNSRRTDVPVAEPRTFPKPERLPNYLRHDESWGAPEKVRSLVKDWTK